MNKHDDLELTVISCLLNNPEYMKETILKDEYFVKHKRLWKFLKVFYNKYKTFDLNLMYAVADDKPMFMMHMEQLTDYEILTNHFKEYELMLKEKYYEDEKEQWISEQVFGLASEFYVKSIDLNEFKIKLDKIYEYADRYFKNKGEK